mgnify:FL=1
MANQPKVHETARSGFKQVTFSSVLLKMCFDKNQAHACSINIITTDIFHC